MAWGMFYCPTEARARRFWVDAHSGQSADRHEKRASYPFRKRQGVFLINRRTHQPKAFFGLIYTNFSHGQTTLIPSRPTTEWPLETVDSCRFLPFYSAQRNVIRKVSLSSHRSRPIPQIEPEEPPNFVRRPKIGRRRKDSLKWANEKILFFILFLIVQKKGKRQR